MATTDKAYCTEAQVEAITQVGDYGNSDQPTEAEVLEFMENRAAELYALLVQAIGSTNAPGPSGYANPIDTTTDQGLALFNVLRQYNAIGAAADALEAAGASQSPGRSERVIELLGQWEDRKDAILPLAQAYLGTATAMPTETHISSGEISQRSVTSREEDGWPTDGTTEW